nr:hypothetical protein [Sphingomonas laterariae]
MAQIEEPFVGFLGHGAVDAREAVLIDFGRQLAALLDLGHGAEFQRGQFARPLTNTIGEIVTIDNQVLAQIVLPPNNDMDMGMAGIVVIDSHPIEFRAKVGLDAAHQIAGVVGEIGKIGGILGRDDEAELVAIILAAIKEGISISAVLGRRIELATLAITRCSVALDVAQMGSTFAIPPRALNVSGFDDDATHSGCAVTPPARQGSGADIGRATATLDARTFASARCLPALSGRTR